MTLISLKPDWDFQPKIGQTLGHHIKREKESIRIIDFLERGKEGGLLLCGDRGVGKTTLTYSCINEIKNKENTREQTAKTLIPILINATSIISSEESSKTIIQHLIRSLYNNTKSLELKNDLKSKTKELFNKSTASKLLKEKNNIVLKKTQTENKISFNSIMLLGFFVSGILASTNLVVFPLEWIAVISGLYLVINFTHQKISVKSDITSQYILHDYDLPTMQLDFENTINEFSKSHKIVFVIDELDKLKDTPLDFIQDIKMLINQGNAHYVFISDPSPLEKVSVPKSKESTLFSQYLFIKHPSFSELDEFFADITMESNPRVEQSDFEIFTKFLLYESQCHFFSLYNLIRDHIVGKSGNCPMLDFKVDNNMIIKANLQRTIEWIYLRIASDHNSEWMQNDRTLSTLYRASNKIFELPNQTHITFGKSGITIQNDESFEIPHSELQHVEDFFNFLVSQGYLDQSSDSNFIKVGSFNKFNSDPGGIYIQEQRIFVKKFRELLDIAIPLVNFYNKYHNNVVDEIFNIDNIRAKWNDAVEICRPISFQTYGNDYEIYSDIESNSSSLYTSRQLNPKNIELDNYISQLYANSVRILCDVLSENTNCDNVAHYTAVNEGSILQRLNLPSHEYYHSVLKYQNKSKIGTVLVIYDPSLDVLQEIDSNLKDTLVVCLFKTGSKEDFSKMDDSVNDLKRSIRNKSSGCYFLRMQMPFCNDEYDSLASLLNDKKLLLLNDEQDLKNLPSWFKD